MLELLVMPPPGGTTRSLADADKSAQRA